MQSGYIYVAGPIFAQTLKNIKATPLQTFQPKEYKEEDMPGTTNSFITSLLPVILLIITTVVPFLIPATDTNKRLFAFIGDPSIVMLLSLIVATYTLWLARGKSIKVIMNQYADAVKDIAVILLIVAGAGALKQIFTDSGVSAEIASLLQGWDVEPLLLAWLIACVIRVCVGSATVAGLTTAGIVAPVMAQTGADPNLMVLSIGAGSLMFSHVNDSGFWLFKEYFNLSIKDTIRSWSLMETIVAIVGLIGVLILNIFI